MRMCSTVVRGDSCFAHVLGSADVGDGSCASRSSSFSVTKRAKESRQCASSCENGEGRENVLADRCFW